jgi:hypothetical protein
MLRVIEEYLPPLEETVALVTLDTRVRRAWKHGNEDPADDKAPWILY